MVGVRSERMGVGEGVREDGPSVQREARAGRWGG